MKYLQKTTLCLAAIVVVALGNNVMATTLDPSSVDQVYPDDYTGVSLTVNNANNDGGSAILTHPANATLDIATGGVVKVGTLGGKTGTGATTVENGGILDITAATTDCIAGNVEVKSGGILQVDADIPASDGPFASGAGLTVRSGAILKLGAGKKWSKNLTIS